MPYNPSTSRAECNYHAGLVNQDSKNQPQTSNRESYNTFDKRHTVADTQLFDEVRPFYMNQANSGDVKRARMVNNDWSPVTKSQILSDIKKHRALFQVPWSVIMPNTWEYLYREPVQGSDITWSNVAPLLSKTALVDLINGILPVAGKEYFFSGSVGGFVEGVIKAVWCYNSVFGNSSLPQTLGVRVLSESFFKSLSADYDFSPSAVFSRLCEFLVNGVTYTIAGGSSTKFSLGQVYSYMPDVVSSPSGSSARYSFTLTTPADAFNFIRDFIWYSKSYTLEVGRSGGLSEVQADVMLSYIFYGVTNFASEPTSMPGFVDISDALSAIPADYTYNLMPLIAYQCLWHQFYTNDRVDAVYSARSWQTSVLTYAQSKSSGDVHFTVNGVNVFYDAFSRVFVDKIANLTTVGYDSSYDDFDYFNELFSVRPSMRGSDYFTSMRIRPLAVGDVDVTVNSGVVSAIDVNKALWYQRFLNAVNRTKQSIYDYLQSMTGVLPERREPQPNFILEEVFNLTGMQVENTGESQGNIVSILRNTQSNYVYDIFIDEPSFIIGVDSYSTNYVYPDSCNKIARMSDRLEWFNDYMQHIGDQQVSLGELFTPSDLSTLDDPIGYQLRYAEFKNMISRACGGFIADDTDLASWLILYAPASVGNVVLPQTSYISPYFIRNHASDFDKLFASLTGFNLSNRFHVVKYTFVDEMDNSKQQAYPTLV